MKTSASCARNRCQVVLIYVSGSYFQSKNCCRKMLRALCDGRPILALMEPEERRDGLSMAQACAPHPQASLAASVPAPMQWHTTSWLPIESNVAPSSVN